ncbi:MAG: ATP-grasp domain-containing protein, partial [Gammaproteobacteria bacterium]|nr:ATP-grasp domain-containing protein [Gammaproteobacteria bacterium]
IKPSHLAGSLHITKAHSMEELEKTVSHLLNDNFLDLGHKMSGDVLIEEYIDGKEYSVEGYIDHDGKINFVSITDKFLGESPYFVEIGHIVKAQISPEIENQLFKYTCSIIRALNITLGVFHCEMRLSSRGPLLIEIAARLVGDNISELIQIATGISLAEKMVKSYLRQPLQSKSLSQFKQYAGIQFIYEKKLTNKIFSHVEGVKKLSKLSGFYHFNLLMKPGEKIFPFTDYRSRIAEVIFTGATYEEVKVKLTMANKLLTVKCAEAS